MKVALPAAGFARVALAALLEGRPRGCRGAGASPTARPARPQCRLTGLKQFALRGPGVAQPPPGLTASSPRRGRPRRRGPAGRRPQVLVVRPAYGSHPARAGAGNWPPLGALNIHGSLLPRWAARRRNPARHRGRHSEDRHSPSCRLGRRAGTHRPMLLAEGHRRSRPAGPPPRCTKRLAVIGARCIVQALGAVGAMPPAAGSAAPPRGATSPHRSRGRGPRSAWSAPGRG